MFQIMDWAVWQSGILLKYLKNIFLGKAFGNDEIIEIFGIESAVGKKSNKIFRYFNTFEIQNQNSGTNPWSKGCGRNDSVAGPEVPKTILENKLKAAIFPEEKEEILKELRQLLDNR